MKILTHTQTSTAALLTLGDDDIKWLGPVSGKKYTMMTSSNRNIFRVTGHCAGNSPVPGEFPTQRPVTRSFDVFFHLRLNKRLSKQWWGWWFETPSRPLWRHRNVGILSEWRIQWNHYIHQQLCNGWLYLGEYVYRYFAASPKWTATARYNGRDGVWNHQPQDWYSTFIQGADQRKHQSFASLAFVRGIHWLPVNSPHKGSVTRKKFPFDDVER